MAERDLPIIASSETVAEVPRGSGAALDLAIIALVSLLGGLLIAGSPGIFRDGDVSWHIATGQWMLDHRAVPRVDPFSFSAAGHRWIAHEWLAELVIGIADLLGGFPAVGFLTLAAVVSTLAIAGLWMRRWANPPELAVSLVLMFVVLGAFVFARPMVLAWPLLAAWTVLLLQARERGTAPPPWWTVGLMLLWVNFHASWAIGFLLAGAFGLEALLASPDRASTARQWALYGATLLAATLINPNFVDTLLIPLAAFTSPSITAVQEFKPTDLSTTPAFGVALFLIAVLALLRRPRLGLVRVAVMAALLYLALAHMRHQALFMIVGALVLVPALTRRAALGLEPKPGLARAMGLGSRGVLILVLGGLTLCAVVGGMRVAALVPVESKVNPLHAFAAIPASLRGQPVLNDYNLGGPLILRGIRPFVDGRGDVYGERFFTAYVKIRSGDPDALREADARWHFAWAITSPASPRLLRLLDGSNEWRRIYADRFAVIHVRQPRTPASAAPATRLP